MNEEALIFTLAAAAKAVAWDYGAWISQEDLQQEAWVWSLRHPLLVDKLDAEGKLQHQVRDHLRLIAQRERAHRVGYHPDDVEYYTPAQVARYLPLALDIEGATAPKGAPLEGGEGDIGKGSAATPNNDDAGRALPRPSRSMTGNPHALSDLVCSLVDIKNAWINTPLFGYEKDAIRLRYVEDLNWFEVADRLGVELEDAKRAVAVGLRRLTDFLGGFRGRSCPADCEDCTQRLVDED